MDENQGQEQSYKTCGSCGTPLAHGSQRCPYCGRSQGKGRSRGVAVALAAVFTYWSFLYTYKRDSRKFWLGLAMTMLAASDYGSKLSVVALIGIWVWVVLDRALKSKEYYTAYPFNA